MRGHIAKRGDRWQVTVDLGKDPITGKRRRKAITYATLAEAEDALPELLDEGRARRPAPKGLTVGELLERWLEQIEPERSPNTIRGYRKKVTLYLLPAFGELELSKLTADRIDRLYASLRSRGLAASTIRQTHACLSGACQMAVRYKWLRENPCADAEPPAIARREVEAPDLAQIRAVFAHLSEDMADAASLAIATGARRGELCGLRWSDVQVVKGGALVTIRRSIGDRLEVIEDYRKSKLRVVAVGPETDLMLEARRKRRRVSSLGDDYVLTEEPGQMIPLKPERLTGRWRDACEKARVKVRFHDLRHLSVTHLLASGISVANVAGRHGHGEDVMLGTYGHALREVDVRAGQIASALAADLSVRPTAGR